MDFEELRKGTPAEGVPTGNIEVLRRLYVVNLPAPFNEMMQEGVLEPTDDCYHEIRDAIDADETLRVDERYVLHSELFQRWASLVDGERRDDEAFIWIYGPKEK